MKRLRSQSGEQPEVIFSIEFDVSAEPKALGRPISEIWFEKRIIEGLSPNF